MSLASIPLPEVAAASPGAGVRHSWLERVCGTTALHAIVVVAVVVLAVPRTFADPDIWWHLRDAQFLAGTHHFLTHDLFSFTAAGAPWINHEWLAELPFYAAWRVAGNNGLYAVTIACIAAIMLGIYALARARSQRPSLSLAFTVLATLLSTVSFGPRTLLFGWLLLVCELAVLQASLRRPRLAWALPALFAVWVNTHGSWMIGLVLFALFTIGHSLRFDTPWLHSDGLPQTRIRRYAAVFAASIAALFVNPYGWRLVFYPFDLAFHQKLNVASVSEWQTLDLHTPRGKIALLTLIGVAVFQLIRPRRWQLADAALLALGIYAGFTYSRFLFLFAILAAPIVAATWRSTRRAERTERTLVNAAAMIAVAMLVFSSLRQPAKPDSRAGAPLPNNLATVLATLPPHARVFNDYEWGGLMTWQTPSVPVFIDSRMDIFERNGTLADYLNIVHFENSLALLDRHGITHVLFPQDSPFVYFLEHTGNWRIVTQQGGVVLLARSSHA